MAIPDKLWNALQTAREAYFKAVETMNAILRDAPSGLPQTDGAFRISQASRIQKIAHDRYMDALQEYNDGIEHARQRQPKF